MDYLCVFRGMIVPFSYQNTASPWDRSPARCAQIPAPAPPPAASPGGESEERGRQRF